MSEQIDWSKAPEWADKYGVAGPEALHCWYSDNQYAYISDPKEVFIFSNFDTFSRHIKDVTMVVARPSPAWSGEGLPPVGVVCELRCLPVGAWGKAEIKYISETQCVWLWVRDDGGYQVELAEVPDVARMAFRPVRTPEQIAAEDRERFAQELVTAMGKGSGPNSLYQARRMYDLGYRKAEVNDAV